MFYFKSFYDNPLFQEEVAFLQSSIQIPEVPRMCVSSLGWRLEATETILMVENLRNRKVTYVSWSYMGKSLGEDVDHPLTPEVTFKNLNWFGGISVITGTVKDKNKRRKIHKSRNVAPLTRIWAVCKVIYRRVFKGVARNFEQLRRSSILSLTFFCCTCNVFCREDECST